MKLKDYANLKEMLIDFNEYSTDYTKTRCKELEKTIENTLEEIERLNNIINKVYKYLDEKKDVPEWWDTDFMICMDILKGGTGYLKDILGSDNNE